MAEQSSKTALPCCCRSWCARAITFANALAETASLFDCSSFTGILEYEEFIFLQDVKESAPTDVYARGCLDIDPASSWSRATSFQAQATPFDVVRKVAEEWFGQNFDELFECLDVEQLGPLLLHRFMSRYGSSFYPAPLTPVMAQSSRKLSVLLSALDRI